MDKSHKNHCLVFDPISFKGGSKIATLEALGTVSAGQCQFTVVTATPKIWQDPTLTNRFSVKIIPLPLIRSMAKCHQGWGYWLNQLFFSAFLLLILIRFPSIKRVIGASGPGIDMPLYIVSRFFTLDIIQFIHGPIGRSSSIGWCLTKATQVFYLHSATNSMLVALDCYYQRILKIADTRSASTLIVSQAHFATFHNGISAARWPTRCQQTFPVVFWSASLLKWKGLDTLIDMLHQLNLVQPVAANICFIRPKDLDLPVSDAPVNLRHVQWYQDPDNLDDIRSQSNIFVSTSHNEPFGLSILEALAAGMCVVIPDDDSYWSQRLVHCQSCLKYTPSDANSLSQAIVSLLDDKRLTEQLSKQSLLMAKHYRAETCYQQVAQRLSPPLFHTDSHCVNDEQCCE